MWSTISSPERLQKHFRSAPRDRLFQQRARYQQKSDSLFARLHGHFVALARHSTARLTLDVYVHRDWNREAAAVAALPDFIAGPAIAFGKAPRGPKPGMNERETGESTGALSVKPSGEKRL